jgi:hypothetical protein
MSMKNSRPNNKTGLIEITKVSDSIISFKYKDRDSLCSAMCRIEESYESPEFAKKVFTLGQYRQWYSERFGAWTYNRDWSGFNIPSDSLKPFFDGMFDPLTESEAEIVELLKYRKSKFCLIGTFEGCDDDVYEHEICHALFSTNDGYKQDVLAVLEEYRYDLDHLKKHLRDDLGYGDNVILDECHAYISESWEWIEEKGIVVTGLIEINEKLQGIKDKYTKDIK